MEDHGDDPQDDHDDGDDEHGIDSAYYKLVAEVGKGGKLGAHWPTLECTCGQAFTEESWGDAGDALDEHLEQTDAGDDEDGLDPDLEGT